MSRRGQLSLLCYFKKFTVCFCRWGKEIPSMENNAVSTSDNINDSKSFVTDIFALKKLDTDLYIAPSLSSTWIPGTTFGGLAVSQALYAASTTVPAGLVLHSMHSYFIRAGDPGISTIYSVQHTRDGRSFSSRTVTAKQQGKYTLTLQASFHKEDAEPASVLEYQPVMPSVNHHQDLLLAEECLDWAISAKIFTDQWVSVIKSFIEYHSSLQIKPVHPHVYMRMVPNPNRSILTWFRASAVLGDENMHRCIAAYLSDFYLLLSALSAGTEVIITKSASLDHSIWFHKPVKMDEWMLYETVGVQVNNNRAFCQGRLWTEDRQLVASVNQEGLVRGKL